MGPLFLISSETKKGQPGHNLIQLLSSQGYPVIAFVKDFENVSILQSEFPTTVIFIVLEVTKNTKSLSKILNALPVANYVINFSGEKFLDIAQEVLERLEDTEYRVKEREYGELTLSKIIKERDGDGCRILINVVEERSEVKKTSEVFTRSFNNLVRSLKKGITQIAGENGESSAATADNERTPLLSNNGNSHINGGFQSSDEQGWFCGIFSIFSTCCPCIFSNGDVSVANKTFQTPEELQAQICSEQLSEINSAFRTLHEDSQTNWQVTLDNLKRKEMQKGDELVAKVQAAREQHLEQLNARKNHQNQQTRENLGNTGVLSEDIVKQIEASRYRHSTGAAKFASDRKYQEGIKAIAGQIAMEKAQLYEHHYVTTVQKEIEKLTEIKGKYEAKYKTLYARYFGQCNNA